MFDFVFERIWKLYVNLDIIFEHTCVVRPRTGPNAWSNINMLTSTLYSSIHVRAVYVIWPWTGSGNQSRNYLLVSTLYSNMHKNHLLISILYSSIHECGLASNRLGWLSSYLYINLNIILKHVHIVRPQIGPGDQSHVKTNLDIILCNILNSSLFYFLL